MSQALALSLRPERPAWLRRLGILLAYLAVLLWCAIGWAVLVTCFLALCAAVGAILQTYLTALATHPTGALAFPVYGVAFGIVVLAMSIVGER